MFVIKKGWEELLKEEFEKEYLLKLLQNLKLEYKTKKIYPPMEEVFFALNILPYEKVKVVIIGQDPYHNPHQAHGLSFSVKEGVNLPPSLKNIFKELNKDLGYKIPNHGNLTKWAKEGVLLLNATLTVEEARPNSHKDLGWQTFTKQIVRLLNKRQDPIVFLLWGAFAKEFSSEIDTSKHYILSAAHPSPFSANNGFFGSKHFSKTNQILTSLNKEPIDWKIENI